MAFRIGRFYFLLSPVSCVMNYDDYDYDGVGSVSGLHLILLNEMNIAAFCGHVFLDNFTQQADNRQMDNSQLS